MRRPSNGTKGEPVRSTRKLETCRQYFSSKYPCSVQKNHWINLQLTTQIKSTALLKLFDQRADVFVMKKNKRLNRLMFFVKSKVEEKLYNNFGKEWPLTKIAVQDRY